MGAALLCHGSPLLSPAAHVLSAMQNLRTLASGENTPEAICLRLRLPNFRQLVSVAMLPAALRAISPKAVTICSMFSGA